MSGCTAVSGYTAMSGQTAISGFASLVRRAALPFFLFAAAVMPAAATENTSGLADAAQQERFRELTWELRCPKCQNQNLADSNAPVAEDLRSEIVRLIGEGRSNDEIVEYMVARYGEFVRYEPRASGINLLLWLLPAAGLLIGALVIFLRARGGDTSAPLLMDDAQRAQVQRLLDEAAPPADDDSGSRDPRA